MTKIWIALLVVGAGFVLAACGSLYEQEPVGIGKDYSELKKSPCACLELKHTRELPEWIG